MANTAYKVAAYQAFRELLSREPYYGTMLSRMGRISGGKEVVERAAVGVNDYGSVVLLINEDFFLSLTPKERVAVLKHECLHVTFGHLSAIARQTFPDHVRANVAMDVAINQLIDDLPEGCLYPESFPRLKLMPLSTTSYYYRKISPEDISNLTSDGGGEGGGRGKDGSKTVPGTIEEPGEMTVSDKVSPEEVDAACRAAVEEAYNEAKKKGWGSVPGELVQKLDRVFAPRVDWRFLLRDFVGRAIRYYKEPSYKRKHRRFGWALPGAKPARGAQILVAIDVSGSITKDELAMFASELDDIAANVDVTLVTCDAKIQQVLPYSPGDWKGIKWTGGGGTSFLPLRTAIERGELPVHPNCIIYFTDGFGDYPKDYLGIPTLWVINNDRANPPFGKVIRIKPPDSALAGFNPRRR